MGVIFAPTRFYLVRSSVRDLVADGKSWVRNSGVGGGGQNRILKVPCPIWLADRGAEQWKWMEEVPRRTSLVSLQILCPNVSPVFFLKKKKKMTHQMRLEVVVAWFSFFFLGGGGVGVGGGFGFVFFFFWGVFGLARLPCPRWRRRLVCCCMYNACIIRYGGRRTRHPPPPLGSSSRLFRIS